MKKSLTGVFILLVSLLLWPAKVNSQIDKIFNDCKTQIKPPFINTGQPMQAFLTGEEVAEFRTTLFDGNIYRVVTCSPDDQKIWFSVYDSKRNLLFNSKQHQFSSSWDFIIEGTMDCIIEAGLDASNSESGMALLMVGFTNKEMKQ